MAEWQQWAEIVFSTAENAVFWLRKRYFPNEKTLFSHSENDSNTPLLQWRQRIDDIDNEDVGSKDDDIHQQTDTHKIAEAVAARAVDQHVSG